MKKKQPDFQKVKLKVGKHLPKGRNETNTSFQSKKINLREQIKETAQEPTLKELLSFMKSSDVKTKYSNLRKLLKYVSDNKDTLSMDFFNILKELGKALQEQNVIIRAQAITVLGRCAEILTDIQFKSFAGQLTTYLNCMMTHLTFSVKQDSLKLLDELLKSHSNIICSSVEILFYLLNMISCKENSTVKKGNKNKDGRKLLDVINSKMSADEWRIQVLERILSFLSGLFPENDNMDMIIDDQKETYWNGNEQLYLPLYLNSGVEPAEFDYSLYTSVNAEDNQMKLKKFIPELISVLSAILKSFSTNRSLSESNIKYFSLIVQILCYTGEWAIQNIDKDDDLNPVQKMIPVCDQLLKGFPYNQQAGKSAKKNEVECVHLNLGISYFYCMCSFLTDIPDKPYLIPEKSYFDEWESIKEYLASVFVVSGAKMNEKTISLSLKMCRILIQCSKLDASAKDGFLVGLLGTLDTNKFSSTADDIYSFFMDLSLNYDYKDLLTTQAMRSWFQSLIKYLSFMMESKAFIPNYLNYITQICARRNPYFMETLRSLTSEKLLEFLKFDNEDFQITIAHLIVSLDEILTPDFFEDLAEIIRDESFSVSVGVKLIRMLHNRFSQPDVPPPNKEDFIRFLLNLGCDTFLLFDPSLDTDPLPLTDMLLNVQQPFGCQWEVYPTADYDRHEEIFKACWDSLNHYCSNKMHLKSVMFFIRQIFSECVKYPVHSAVAIIELFRAIPPLAEDTYIVDLLQHIIYSFLLYISVVTNDIPEDHWVEYCVPAVQKSLEIMEPSDVIIFWDKIIHTFAENQLYHTLRILLFLMRKGCFELLDKNSLYMFFAKLRKLDVFERRPIFRIMWKNMYEYLKHW